MTTWTSTREAVAMCGLRLVRRYGWKHRVLGPAGETLYEGTLPGVRAWLRRTGRVA